LPLTGGDVGENLAVVGMFEAKKFVGGLFGKKSAGSAKKSSSTAAITDGVKTLATGKSSEIKVTNKGQVHIVLTAVDFDGSMLFLLSDNECFLLPNRR
jgi:hypothetical protein